MQASAKCELCFSENVVLYPYYDYLFEEKLRRFLKRSINFVTGRKRYKIVQELELFKKVKFMKCSDCGFASVYPRLSLDELVEFYKQDYGKRKRDKLPETDSIRPVNQYNYIAENIPINRIGSLIEFGAGGAAVGRYTATMCGLNDMTVVEPRDQWHEAYKYGAENINAYHSLFEVKETYDLFLASHALQCVSDFDLYMTKMIEVVNPGGYMFFEGPNCNNIWYRVKRRRSPYTVFCSLECIDKIVEKYPVRLVHKGAFGYGWDEDDTKKTDKDMYKLNDKGRFLRFILQKI